MKTFVAPFALLASTLTFLAANDASAFSFDTCNGSPVKWGSTFSMKRASVSFPSGTPALASLENAVNQWRGVIGMNDMVQLPAGFTFSGNLNHGNGANEVALVNRSDIDGNNGLTVNQLGPCFIGANEIDESDVMVAADMSQSDPAQDALEGSGRVTMFHEFGHAHGLNHAQNFNMMRVPGPRPLIGGSGEQVDALPDDARGGRFLYGSGKNETNLFSSAQRLTGGSIFMNHTGTVISCSGGGGQLTVNSTVGNNGTVNVTQTERWWVSTSSTAFGGGTLVGQWNGSTFNANGVLTRLVTMTMPPLPVGTYFFYHGVDVFNSVSESREDDNAVREGLRIKVITC